MLNSLLTPLVLLCLVQAPPIIPAQDGHAKKPAWEWTIEERIAERLNPAKIAQRARGPEVEDPSSYSISGREHPELLLPHEIFDVLITALGPEDPEHPRRKYFATGIRAFGFEETLFWSKLYTASEEYVTFKSVTGDAISDSATSGHAEASQLGCRAAFRALANARLTFGPEHFDRFLYEVVAPMIEMASATNAKDPRQDLRHVAGGCR